METIFFTFLIILLIYKLNFRLIIENFALRQQLAIMKQSVRRPKIRKRDRLFWVILSRLWNGWKNVLIVVQPETVIRWHRKGFKLYWKSKSQKAGRPPTDIKVQRIVKKMIKENPLWGAPTLHGELIKLGIVISERTVSNMVKRYRVGNPPSQTWRTFLKNHMNNTYAIDFFTVPTANFKILYVFVILWHERRKVVHFNVTLNPTAQWTAQQIKNILSEYFKYYHHDRTHLGLSKDTPFERQVQFEPKNGILIPLLRVGGLHHRYIWKEAA